MVAITENYAFEKDRYNFTLYYTGKKKKGVFGKPNHKESNEEVEFQEKIGHYNTISGMLKAAADNAVGRKIEAGQVKDIEEYLSAFNKVVSELEQAIANVEYVPKTTIRSNLSVTEDEADAEDTDEDANASDDDE